MHAGQATGKISLAGMRGQPRFLFVFFLSPLCAVSLRICPADAPGRCPPPAGLAAGLRCCCNMSPPPLWPHKVRRKSEAVVRERHPRERVKRVGGGGGGEGWTRVARREGERERRGSVRCSAGVCTAAHAHTRLSSSSQHARFNPAEAGREPPPRPTLPPCRPSSASGAANQRGC